MRKYLLILAAVLMSISTHSFAQDESFTTDSVESKIVQVAASADTTADALAVLLSADDETLSDAQKVALSVLPEGAQLFFIEAVISGVSAADSALTTASTQPDITTDLGTDLYNAFAPAFAKTVEEEDQGGLLQTAAGDSGSSPIGFGTGAGGGGGGSATASGN